MLRGCGCSATVAACCPMQLGEASQCMFPFPSLPHCSWADKWKKDAVRLLLFEALLGLRDFGAAMQSLRPVTLRWPFAPLVWNAFGRCAQLACITCMLGGGWDGMSSRQGRSRSAMSGEQHAGWAMPASLLPATQVPDRDGRRASGDQVLVAAAPAPPHLPAADADGGALPPAQHQLPRGAERVLPRLQVRCGWRLSAASRRMIISADSPSRNGRR